MIGGAIATTLTIIHTVTPNTTVTACSSSSTNCNCVYEHPTKLFPTTNTTQSSSPNSRPSLTVRTQSNIRIQKRRKPEPSCVECDGSGRVECHPCHGKDIPGLVIALQCKHSFDLDTGRTNYTDLEMLPKGEWPEWCGTCGGSGLAYCSRCLGTGEYRRLMGFHFMNEESSQELAKHQSQSQEA